MGPVVKTRPVAATAALALAMLFAGATTSAGTTGQLDLFIGQRSFDSDFEPVDDASQIGLALSVAPKGWPIHIALDLMQSSDDASAAATLDGLPITGSADVDVSEINIGVRRLIRDGPWQWRYGGGIAFVEVEVESMLTDAIGPLFQGEESDRSIGGWLGVGGSWRFAERFQAGVDFRYTHAEVDLGDGDDFDASGAQFGLTVGYRW